MLWYIDSVNGNNNNSGHKIDEPLKDLSKFYYTGGSASILKHGDKILIKRGSVFNQDTSHKLYTGNSSKIKYEPVYIGAYGDGENPIFTKHKIVNKENLSVSSDNIYQIDLTSQYVTGNPISNTNVGFIYDEENNIIYGERVFSSSELNSNMKFYINNNIMYIYCDNFDIMPKKLILPIQKDIFTCDANLILENLTFELGGKHGVVTTDDNGNYNITIKNCIFSKIGGSLQKDQVRYGNGFECYGHGYNITIENCYFEDIYDTGVTYQGQGATFENIHFTHNVFNRCSQACENWADNSKYSGSGYKNCTFNDNICLLNGYGFGSVNRENGYGFILNNITNLAYTNLKVYNNIFFKCKNGIYNTVNFNNTNLKFYKNTIYGYENQLINSMYTYKMKDYKDYINTLNQDKSSTFIVLDEDKKGRAEEESLIASNLFLNTLKNIYLTNYFNEKNIQNNISEFSINSGVMNVTMNKCELIGDMLVFAFIGTANKQINQFSTFASINIPGYKVTQQTFANPNDVNKRYYSSQSGDNLLLQTFYQIDEGSKIELNGVIALTKK